MRHARGKGAAAIVGLGAVLVCAALLVCTGCSGSENQPRLRTVAVGFYAFFEPVSLSADPQPGTVGFDTHVGYEADLLSAVEAMEGIGLRFERRGIAAWEGIWLKPATADTDLVGGGITILGSRTVDAAGNTVVAFTDGHIERGGFVVDAADTDLLERMNTALAWLTDNGRIGFADWLAGAEVFMTRAAQWPRSQS